MPAFSSAEIDSGANELATRALAIHREIGDREGEMCDLPVVASALEKLG